MGEAVGNAIEGYKLSPQQRRAWGLSREGSGLYAQCAVTLRGALDGARLVRALDAAAGRHEALRTYFPRLAGMELPLQVVAEAREFSLPTLDLRGAAEPEAELRAALGREREAACGAPDGWRALLALTGEDDAVLVLTASALCCDAGSLLNLLAEVRAEYGGEVVEEAVQYVDYSEWQNELLAGEEAAAGLAYWEGQRGVHPDTRLGFEAGGREAAGRGAQKFVEAECGPRLWEELSAVAAAHGVSEEVSLLAAWQLLLSRHAGSQEVVTSTLFDGRRIKHLRDACGLFARYLPVPVRLTEDYTFSELLSDLGGRMREAHVRQEFYVPAPEVSPSESERPRTTFGFEMERWPETARAAGVNFIPLELTFNYEPFTLRLSASLREGSLFCRLYHDAAQVDAGWARLLLGQYETLLRSCLADPSAPLSRHDALSQAEREDALSQSARNSRPYPTSPLLPELIAGAAQDEPEAEAVLDSTRSVTRRRLWRAAGRVASMLRASGVRRGDRVGLLAGRSAEAVAGLLGCWRLGAAYVPLDGSQPGSRLESMLDDCGASAVLVSGESSPLLGSGREVLDLTAADLFSEAGELGDETGEVGCEAGDIAYLIYTSGTTGRPKGVAVTHSSLLNLLHALDESVYSPHPVRRVSVNAPLWFDASVKQLVQLGLGRALVVVPEGVRADAEALTEWVVTSGVEAFDCTPSHLRALLGAGLRRRCEESGAGLRHLLIGGEAVDPALWAELGGWRGVTSHNLYGPTECTVDVTHRAISQEGEPTLGLPLGNVEAYVLDGRGRLCPSGVGGELCAGGAGIAVGYWGDARRTAEKFIPDPYSGRPGARLYRTGDVARRGADGLISYEGRADGQVKVRGFRIELGEVEAGLRQVGWVSEAAAAVVGEGDSARLVGYVVPHSGCAGGGEGAAVDGDEGEALLLPNGMRVRHRSRRDASDLYDELFSRLTYLRHGVRLPDGACVVDAGANIGFFSLLVSELCDGARVLAFEPLAPLYEAAGANLSRYAPGARVFAHGLSDAERRAEFTFYPEQPARSGQAEYADEDNEREVMRRYLENQAKAGIRGAAELLNEAEDLAEAQFRSERHECLLRPLGEVLDELGVGRVDLLKVDVQRAELDVLRGLGGGGLARVEQVVMEVHDERGGATEGRVLEARALLESEGFEVVVEQEELLEGTDRYNLWAWRGEPGRRGGATAAQVRRMDERARERLAGGAGSEECGHDTARAREYLRHVLPDYMVPAQVVVLDSLPLTSNGKLDRGALPAPEELTTSGRGEGSAPRTPHEEMICGLFSSVLSIGEVGAEDNFFSLGGHSLLATQLVSRVREGFGVSLPLRSLFERPTPRALASEVEALTRAESAGGPPPLTRAERGEGGELPLSFAQQRLWFLDQLEPGSANYNCPAAVRLSGRLDLKGLRWTLAEIVRRHEALRARFVEREGRPVQVIGEAVGVKLPVVDLSGLGEEQREAEAMRLAAEQYRQGFDLLRGPLLRAAVVRLGEREHVGVLTTHHIASDAWSVGVLVREVGALYAAYTRGEASPLEEPEVQYGDYAAWQRGWLQGEALEEQLKYWRGKLAGAPASLELPTDRPRPAAPSHQGARHSFVLSEELSRSLRAMCRQTGTTLFMLMLAAYQTLLQRYTEQDDILIGADIANRNRKETEGLIGFFINMLVLRADLSDNPTFLKLLERARETALDAYAHQDLPFDKLVEELQPERSGLNHSPFFRVVLLFQNTPEEELTLPELTISRLDYEAEVVRFDLTLMVDESAGELRGFWGYSTDLFDTETVERMHGHFVTLLQSVVRNPEARLRDLEMFTEEERRQRDARKQQRDANNKGKLKSVKRKTVNVAPTATETAEAAPGL